ncbi:M20/M25/M40 family metallo-hydrolase [Sporosarcina thermotolerans]|uniref:M20/M25/M40 family metallo-hydrolase n=1 Tax=Sporosarcina thermotolerans TaxID=633404 RepID=UPI0024BC8284|nr:M20/M25/M40 family metallo-hydrolase [Sporosarcina thermotolerans]WHT49868.1 M20/M25/M40 family metallo-hydrolase [Sporosarcina thermotolerans]
MDSVYAAGEFDGTAGVLVALEVMRSLTDENVKTENPLEVIIFACEESARFGASTLGSKAMTGRLDPAYTRSLTDKNGVTLFQAFKENGLDLEEVHLAKRFGMKSRHLWSCTLNRDLFLKNRGWQSVLFLP